MPRMKRRKKHGAGRAQLPEDRMRAKIESHFEAKPRRWHRRQPGPRVQEMPETPFDRRTVEDRVLRGLKTLRALPDRGRGAQAVRCGWPDYVQEAIDAYDSVEEQERFRPTPRDISDYLTSLSWIRHLPRNEWKLLWFRSFDLSFGLIAEYIGRSDETARRRYGAVLTDVWCVANNVQARLSAGLVRRGSRQSLAS